MNQRYVGTIAAIAAGTFLLTACTGDRKVAGTATAPSSSSSSADTPAGGAPKVGSPLPDKVLDGNPCDNAITSEQLTDFLGQTLPAKPNNDALGPGCHWGSASGSGAGINVTYQTKSDQGLNLAYQNVQPKAARWIVLDPVQGYPAVAYASNGGVDPNDKRTCVIVVGVTDQLAYAVALVLGNNAYKEGKDSCVIGRDVADAVMTNLKQRA